MRFLLIGLILSAAVWARALDLKVPNVDTKKLSGADVSDSAMQELTKELKNVQNEKGPIVFKTGSAVLDASKCETTLKATHEIISRFPGFLVQIEGHTDNVGKSRVNLALSQKRAEAVRSYLIKKYKTPAKRMTAKGFGDTKPIADNKTEEGRSKNRRVDFSVFRMK